MFCHRLNFGALQTLTGDANKPASPPEIWTRANWWQILIWKGALLFIRANLEFSGRDIFIPSRSFLLSWIFCLLCAVLGVAFVLHSILVFFFFFLSPIIGRQEKQQQAAYDNFLAVVATVLAIITGSGAAWALCSGACVHTGRDVLLLLIHSHRSANHLPLLLQKLL